MKHSSFDIEEDPGATHPPLQQAAGGGGGISDSAALLPGRSISAGGRRISSSCAVDDAAGNGAAVGFNGSYRTRRRVSRWLLALTAGLAVAALVSCAALSVALSARRTAAAAAASSSLASLGDDGGDAAAAASRQRRPVRRVAFGSCSAYDLRPQEVWTAGVIPAAPDAWVWVGDFAYFDDPVVDCEAAGRGGEAFPECRCAPTFMKRAPSCFAGDAAHARMRMRHQLSIPEYEAFLNFMCPPFSALDDDAGGGSGGGSSGGGDGGSGSSASNSGGQQQQQQQQRQRRRQPWPPAGSDPRECPRPVLGTYDDHDSGWNNGDARNPALPAIKNVYLDGLGEPQGSARRSAARGIETSYTFYSESDDGGGGGSGGGGGTIDVVLLDERYYRDTFPCSVREAWCTKLLARSGDGSEDADAVWCRDFIVDGGIGGRGSCCRKDDEWREWCALPAAAGHPRRRELCDPTAAEFALRGPALMSRQDNATVLPGGREAEWAASAQAGGGWRRLIEGGASPLCEVLGPSQRRWLRGVLGLDDGGDGSSSGSGGSKGQQQQRRQSPLSSPLKLVASGSVLAGSLGHGSPADGPGTECGGGDELSCWHRAQVNLLHTLANASGCVVVLTGDFHFSDIEQIRPGGGGPPGTNYSYYLNTERLAKPVWQVMASGLTRSTARSEGLPCKGTWLEDTVGLRPLGRCAYVPQPAFGMVEVDWKRRRVDLSIRDAGSGKVAIGKDGSKQLVTFNLDTCERV